ncbi:MULTISPECIES: ankyrin repeat domain-containing protein [Wolbachia]|uniref:ankyrin repeat domain-containing protein n=1 Tax=Wolbachia TaxID=953 RepID=UPI000240414F|nr:MULTISPECIES: ankyrin repeat domain-containing protein [Wolbachia]QUI60956.1 ankyrin repeat domain-containing protein [Wolbachia endosymbiont of Spodoptera picta]QZA84133.1 ankyrin repeat domain-containing protein [Wolbachia pipientis]UYC23363.1 ankyrin repeat domain-containing protein [Wolbachia endosymbiont of Aedes aegypti]CCE77302.1 conserved hypothetical protein [Wolbachia pipientis wAlbB]
MEIVAPLFLLDAAQAGHLDVVKYLVEIANAGVNYVVSTLSLPHFDYEKTALMFAAKSSHFV